MSKLDIRLSYEDILIVKHALRDKVLAKKSRVELAKMRCEVYEDGISDDEYIKELEEEERCFKRLIEEIDKAGERYRRNILR